MKTRKLSSKRITKKFNFKTKKGGGQIIDLRDKEYQLDTDQRQRKLFIVQPNKNTFDKYHFLLSELGEPFQIMYKNGCKYDLEKIIEGRQITYSLKSENKDVRYKFNNLKLGRISSKVRKDKFQGSNATPTARPSAGPSGPTGPTAGPLLDL